MIKSGREGMGSISFDAQNFSIWMNNYFSKIYQKGQKEKNKIKIHNLDEKGKEKLELWHGLR